MTDDPRAYSLQEVEVLLSLPAGTLARYVSFKRQERSLLSKWVLNRLYRRGRAIMVPEAEVLPRLAAEVERIRFDNIAGLTPAEAASRLDCEVRTIYNMLTTGLLCKLSSGHRRTRIDIESVIALERRRRREKEDS